MDITEKLLADCNCGGRGYLPNKNKEEAVVIPCICSKINYIKSKLGALGEIHFELSDSYFNFLKENEKAHILIFKLGMLEFRHYLASYLLMKSINFMTTVYHIDELMSAWFSNDSDKGINSFIMEDLLVIYYDGGYWTKSVPFVTDQLTTLRKIKNKRTWLIFPTNFTLNSQHPLPMESTQLFEKISQNITFDFKYKAREVNTFIPEGVTMGEYDTKVDVSYFKKKRMVD